MGNDHSHSKKFHVNEDAIIVNDFYSMFLGDIKNDSSSTVISVFKESATPKGGYWSTKTPLEHLTKNLMIYRHPSILKFIASWKKSSVNFLATEHCEPLILNLSTQNDIQICLGLRNILCALVFLVEKAGATHLNICIESIYIHKKESWRLGGLEHLWSKTTVDNDLLNKSKPHRNKSAIDDNETNCKEIYGIEQYAFGALCEEIFRKKEKQNLTHDITAFLEYCTNQLKNTKSNLRPSLSEILSHPYFNNDFVFIHSFLAEILVKSQSDKQSFFTSLVDRLRKFDEEIVAKGLIDLILSRIVILDETAKFCVIPFVLRPNDEGTSITSTSPLFSKGTFTKYVIPKIKQMFLVRDMQVRAILLEYFPEYINYFPTKEMLTDEILPQLLLGIKDTNEQIVTSTLRCLADLVPILGASVVIGQNRSRIFSDGRPSFIPNEVSDDSISTWANARSITPVIASCSGEARAVSVSPVSPNKIIINDNLTPTETPVFASQTFMLVRLSPDGGEDVETSKECSDPIEDNWSDWEAEEDAQDNVPAIPNEFPLASENIDEIAVICEKSNVAPSDQSSSDSTLIKDIKELNIKVPELQINNEIDDFFKDMEPIIEKQKVIILCDNLDKLNEKPNSQPSNSRLVFTTADDELALSESAWESDWN